MVKRTTANLVAGTAVFSGLLLALLITGCRQSGNTSLKDNIQARLPAADTTANNPHLAYFKQSMAAIGETAAIDTHFSRYLYLGYWYLSKSSVLNIRDVAGDTLSLISLTRSHTIGDAQYADTAMRLPHYIFPQRVTRTAHILRRQVSGDIFRYLDTLLSQKLIRPFGMADTTRHDGDIVDGGYWLMYFDGKRYYESQSATLEALWQRIHQYADLDAMARELNEPVP